MIKKTTMTKSALDNKPFPQTLREAIDTAQWDTVPQVIQNTLQNPANRNGDLLIKMAGMLQHANQPHHAIDTYQQVFDHNPTLTHAHKAHEKLAQLYADTNNFTQAKYHGEHAINLKDSITDPHRPQKNLVAFSLYGSKPEYCETAILNAQAMPDIYPNWTMAVYHDDSVPKHVLDRLAKLNVELVNAKDIHASHMPGTFWRFLALERDDVDVVIMRDADSIISKREKALVDDWLATDKPFHIIRDWYGHTDLILAGLWGARMGLLAHIRHWIAQYLAENPTLHPTHADQFFLAEKIWHRIKPFAVHHSSIYDYANATWLAKLPKHNDQNGTFQQLGGWETTQYRVDTHSDYLAIIREGDTIICQYTMKQGQPLELPRAYKEKIASEKWQLQIIPIQVTIG